MSAFHLAAAVNACDVLEVLINSGVSISEVTSSGQTVLHIAAAKGNYDLCKYEFNMFQCFSICDLKNKSNQVFIRRRRQDASERKTFIGIQEKLANV